jgi:hypothetical protein
MTVAKIYLPKAADNYTDVLSELQTRLCDIFDGFTQYDGKGGWKSRDSEIITEAVTVIEVCSSMTHSETMHYIRPWGNYVLDETDENSVLIVVGGEKVVLR